MRGQFRSSPGRRQRPIQDRRPVPSINLAPGEGCSQYHPRMDETSQCLAILGLKPGASTGEIEAAHRELVDVWDPDRFAGNERLGAKAARNLDQINRAYAQLTGSVAAGEPGGSATPRAAHEPVPAGDAVPAWLTLAAGVTVLAVCGLLLYVRSHANAPERIRPTPENTSSNTFEPSLPSSGKAVAPAAGAATNQPPPDASTRTN